MKALDEFNRPDPLEVGFSQEELASARGIQAESFDFGDKAERNQMSFGLPVEKVLK